jgi:hypothetical protein
LLRGEAEQGGDDGGEPSAREVERGERIHRHSRPVFGGYRYQKAGGGAKWQRKLGVVIAECGGFSRGPILIYKKRCYKVPQYEERQTCLALLGSMESEGI